LPSPPRPHSRLGTVLLTHDVQEFHGVIKILDRLLATRRATINARENLHDDGLRVGRQRQDLLGDDIGEGHALGLVESLRIRHINHELWGATVTCTYHAFVDDVISNDSLVDLLAVGDAAPRLGTCGEAFITRSDQVANLEAVAVLVVLDKQVDILELSY
jgi:hypothetical protein